MIDASHEHGAETWEQRARVCAADRQELLEMVKALRPYIQKMQNDGIQTAVTPATVLRKIDLLLERIK